MPESTEETLNKLHKSLVSSIVQIQELNLHDENDMTMLFPSDMMKYGLGSEIIVEISGLFQRTERTIDVKQRLAKAVGKTVKTFFPNAKVECLVYTFDPVLQGFWSS